jgi:hypothetical protein|tara:strand:+ start:2921 stop:3289 length:369 start_codon:yes stop_codon:yes gene_type:complete
MLKNSSTLSGDESQVILKEILDNQKEALDLNGQLVLLNQKMDVLIEKVGEQSAKPKSALEAILGNSQALISIVFIILVALFLGLGDNVLNGIMGTDAVDPDQLESLLNVIQEAARQTAPTTD